MSKIENHKYNIDEAFRECFYVVPDYQREYVWQDKEVQQLLDDIDEQVDAGTIREYFVGMVLVAKEEQRNRYEVIDGQQRLTTFFLLLCALRQLFRGEEHVHALTGLITSSYTNASGHVQTSLKLDPRYENAGDVVKKLVELNADPQLVRAGVRGASIPTFGSLENLLGAYALIHRHLKDNYDDPEKLRRCWGYVANNVVFIQIATDVSSALKIFETINERGVGLNPMDLLKNLLFTRVSREEFTPLKDEWKKITKPLEKAKEKPLRFLRYFLMASYKINNSRGDGVVREDEIYDWLVNKENAALCDYASKPFDFVRKIIASVDHYLAFTRGFGNDGARNLAMDSLKSLCGAAFSLQYVLLLAASGFPKPLFDHFVRQLESFLFYYIFTKTPTKSLERDFSSWADELREIGIIADLPAQRTKLNTFIEGRFHKRMMSKDQELTDALRRYSLDSMQQYRTRYFLAKLTQYVDMSYKGLTSPGALSEYTVADIEHILPQTPEVSLLTEWTAVNMDCDYDEYKARLGNLTLLEKPINIVASNAYFVEKKVEYGKSKFYLTSSIMEVVKVGKNSSTTRINQKLQSFDEWTARSIDRRQEMLIILARDVWQLAEAPVD